MTNAIPLILTIISSNPAPHLRDTIEISRTIIQTEKRGFVRCKQDSAQIHVQVKIEYLDTLPIYSIDAFYKFDTIFTLDTETISYEFTRKKPNEINTMVTGIGKGGAYCMKDGVTSRADGKHFGFGIYDTFDVIPLQSGKIYFDLKGKLVPWGMHTNLNFNHQILTKSDTTISDRNSKYKTTYTIKFLSNEQDHP